MKNRYSIGLDGGTQSSKVVVFDLAGNIVCQGRQELKPLHMPAPGVVEHPGDDLWDSIKAASRQAMARFEGRPDDIVGIGVCTIRCCRACLKADGTLASPVQSWMDRRLSCAYADMDPQVRYVTTTSGYITHRLTGCFNDTAANYEGPWPIDKDTWQWSRDPAVIRAFNVAEAQLFALQMPGTVLGRLTREAAAETHLPAGIPVVATANDKSVEALGAGLLPGNTGLVSLGTYIGGMVYGERNRPDAKAFFANLAAIPHHYLYESGGIRQGMWTVSWIRKLFGEGVERQAKQEGIAPETVLNREAKQVPVGSEGLMTVPEWLAPPTKPYKKGIMIGFHGRHTRAHLYRSILEAIALTMKNHMDAMCRELDMRLDRVIVSGGGSSGDLFMQIFADVFDLPAVRNEVNGAASLGAAICTAVAADVYPDFPTAIAHMVRIRDSFAPVAENAAAYAAINRVYRHICDYTDPLLQEAHAVFQP